MEEKNVSLNQNTVVLNEEEKKLAVFIQSLSLDLIDVYNFKTDEMGVVARDLIAKCNNYLSECEDDIVDSDGNTIPMSLYHSIILRYINNLESALEGMLTKVAEYQEPETIKELVNFNKTILGGN